MAGEMKSLKNSLYFEGILCIVCLGSSVYLNNQMPHKTPIYFRVLYSKNAVYK